MRLRLDLDDTLAEALLQHARKALRYPDQQVEAILREALGVPVISHLPLVGDEPPDDRRHGAIEAAQVP
jgi:hypothetical protein